MVRCSCPDTVYSRTGFECGVTCADETHGRYGVFRTHGGLEIGHGGVLALRVAGTPFGEEADHQTAEHSQDPDGVAITDAALIFVGRRVKTLMEATLDAPILTDALQPLPRVQALWRKAAEQLHCLGLVFAEMAIQLCDLLDMWEADLLSGGRLGMNLAAFAPPPVQFVSPSHRRVDRLRGKNPPAWRRNVRGVFVGCPFGCP